MVFNRCYDDSGRVSETQHYGQCYWIHSFHSSCRKCLPGMHSTLQRFRRGCIVELWFQQQGATADSTRINGFTDSHVYRTLRWHPQLATCPDPFAPAWTPSGRLKATAHATNRAISGSWRSCEKLCLLPITTAKMCCIARRQLARCVLKNKRHYYTAFNYWFPTAVVSSFSPIQQNSDLKIVTF